MSASDDYVSDDDDDHVMSCLYSAYFFSRANHTSSYSTNNIYWDGVCAISHNLVHARAGNACEGNSVKLSH
jgi:hypothetical protein